MMLPIYCCLELNDKIKQSINLTNQISNFVEDGSRINSAYLQHKINKFLIRFIILSSLMAVNKMYNIFKIGFFSI